MRVTRVEHEVLRPIGYTTQSFQESGAKQLGNIAAQVLQGMGQFNLGVELLLAGFAEGAARLAHINHPGTLRFTDGLEFYAIGSGASHALLSLLFSGCSATQPGAQVLFNAYVAKRSAEAAPGVGDHTDLYVARDGHAAQVTPEIHQELARMYDELIASRHKDQDHGKLKELISDALGQQEAP